MYILTANKDDLLTFLNFPSFPSFIGSYSSEWKPGNMETFNLNFLFQVLKGSTYQYQRNDVNNVESIKSQIIPQLMQSQINPENPNQLFEEKTMLFHLELMQTSISHVKNFFLLFLNHVLNWMFHCQDVIRSKPGFTLAEGKWSNQTPQSASLLKKDSIADIPI